MRYVYFTLPLKHFFNFNFNFLFFLKKKFLW